MIKHNFNISLTLTISHIKCVRLEIKEQYKMSIFKNYDKYMIESFRTLI